MHFHYRGDPRTVDEKEMLLRELQHRVKNSLAIISSLLGLEMRKVPDERSRQVFREAQTRIYTMSTMYDQLFCRSPQY
jgi:two-component sensor histidine kinase